MTRTFILISCLTFAGSAWTETLRMASPSEYDVIWDTPSANHHGSMPLGNGDISANAWIEPSGDLFFYIGKTDSWDEHGRLLKVGRVRISFDPPLPVQQPGFQQRLDLATGTLRIHAGPTGESVRLALRVDAHHPVIELDVHSDQPRAARLQSEPWRTQRQELPSLEVSDVMMHAPPDRKRTVFVEADPFIQTTLPLVAWYHHNTYAQGPDITGEIQGTRDLRTQDPLLNRIFGAALSATSARKIDERTLELPANRTHHIRAHVRTMHPAQPDTWWSVMRDQIRALEKSRGDTRAIAHERWWSSFWERSWIHARQQSGAGERLVPRNAIPFKVGIDQAGGNRIAGTLAGTRIKAGVASADEVAARSRAGAPSSGDAIVLPAHTADLAPAFTAETFLRMDAPAAGRLIDSITPAGSDGFLLDLPVPGTLRVIVGADIVQAAVPLKTGTWHHVAATVDPATGVIRLYCDGQRVAEEVRKPRDAAFEVSRAYALQRYITACAGRGHYPIKFNGSIFTVPHAGTPGDADYRRWGPGYWWQNTRLPYISLCTSGDMESFEPLLRMYVDELLPFNRARTERYFGFKDAAYYPECIYFWGDVFSESYGWTPLKERKDPLQDSRWHKWEWVAGPELVYFMLDLYEHTGDAALLRKRIFPTAQSIIRFFELYYPERANGQIVMQPSQAVETWWDCTDPMPEVAGLRAMTLRLLALPKSITTASQRAKWSEFLQSLPPLPTRMIEGQPAWAPAARFAAKSNIENPELYAVYPFRLSSFNRTNAPQGILALKHRWDRGHSGWRQDELFMAYLGLAQEAREGIVQRARQWHGGSRFPAFWGPNYDWVPDQDHGGVLMKTLQSMALQTEPRTGSAQDGSIFLLPAWPEDWDVDFRLHAPQRTIVELTFRKGRIERCEVTPRERTRDVKHPD